MEIEYAILNGRFIYIIFMEINPSSHACLHVRMSEGSLSELIVLEYLMGEFNTANSRLI